LICSITAQPTIAQTADLPVVATISAVHETPTGKLQRLAVQTALADGLNPYVFALIITKESQWNPHAISATHDYGLVQINLPSHPEVTKQEAFDPDFSLHWMGEQWKEGNENEWTTYREYMRLQ
jgi:hypothetical protein